MQGIAMLVNAQQQLTQNPAVALTQLIRQYGQQPGVIDNVLSQFRQEPSDDSYADPELTALKTQVSTLQDHLNQQNQTQQNQQLAAQQQAISDAQAAIDDFAQATDDSGNLKHPHFEEVRDDMQAMFTSGLATDLETAYESAIWSRPELRDKLLKQKTEDAMKLADAKRKESVERSKKKSKAPPIKRAAPESSSDATSDESVRDSLMASIDELGVSLN